MRLALRFGFVTLLVALGVGAAMIAVGSTATRGPDPSLAYTTAGFLKPAHTVTMHAILIIPALAWLLGFTRWGENQKMSIVRLAIAGYSILSVTVLVESIAHTSPLAASPLATGVSAAGLGMLAAAGALALAGLRSRRGTAVPAK